MAVTDGQVWDRLHEVFGVGDYDARGADPWHRWRAKQVGLLRRLRESRRVTPEDLLTTIEYCRQHRIDIRHVSWLFRHITPARQWAKAKAAADLHQDLEARITRAIEIEGTNPDSQWLDRLARASGDGRLEVYREWERSSGSPGTR